jgi:hypothetical protein
MMVGVGTELEVSSTKTVLQSSATSSQSHHWSQSVWVGRMVGRESVPVRMLEVWFVPQQLGWEQYCPDTE